MVYSTDIVSQDEAIFAVICLNGIGIPKFHKGGRVILAILQCSEGSMYNSHLYMFNLAFTMIFCCHFFRLSKG